MPWETRGSGICPGMPEGVAYALGDKFLPGGVVYALELSSCQLMKAAKFLPEGLPLIPCHFPN